VSDGGLRCSEANRHHRFPETACGLMSVDAIAGHNTHRELPTPVRVKKCFYEKALSLTVQTSSFDWRLSRDQQTLMR
jgi:hypothetical protein